MNYVPLYKIYYSDPSHYEDQYSERFNSPGTRKFNFFIREIHRPNEYPCFLCYTENITQLTEQIYEQVRRISETASQCPAVMLQQYAESCLVEEVQSTNEIEGVKSTRKQIRDILQNNPVPKNDRHLKSVIDKYMKILHHASFTFDTCEDIRSFYNAFALDEVIQENPANAPDGKIFRKDIVEIASKTNKAKHQGVYPESKIIDSMKTALNVLHDASIPIVVRLACFHYFFEYIHPFYDGNGRTGRFIISYYLAKYFNPLMALRLSVIINKNKKRYYQMFEITDSQWNRGDLTYFVEEFMKLILQSAEDTADILERKEKQLRKLNQIMEEKFKFSDPLMKDIYFILLQASLFPGIGVTMEDIMNAANKTRVTLRKRLRDIPSSYLMTNKTVRPYRYQLNLENIFH